MSGFFADSEDLKRIIEKHGWTAYHINSFKSSDPDSLWDEMENAEPVQKFYVDRKFHFNENGKSDRDKYDYGRYDQNKYILVKQPEQGQTIREACSSVNYIGPALTLPGVDAHKDMRGRGRLMISGLCTYLFTRLFFRPNGLIATSPQGLYLPKSPVVSIPYQNVLEKFDKYFSIIDPKEVESSVISSILNTNQMLDFFKQPRPNEEN